MRGLSILCAPTFAIACALPAIAATPAQATGALPRGGTYVVQSDPSVSQAVVQLWFRAPASGYDDATPGIAQLAAAACAVAPLVGGQSLSSLARSTGGDLNISVYADIVQVSEAGPASAARRVVAAMTAAYFAPAPDAAALQAARRDAAVLAIERQFSPRLAMLDATFAQLFSSGPAHTAPVVLGGANAPDVSLAAVTAFATRAFRAGNAFLVLTGDVDAGMTSAVTDGSGAPQPDAPFDSQLAQSPQDVSMSGSVDATALAWTGPGIADERAATAMDFINDYLFRAGTGTVTRALAQAGVGAGISGSFVTLHDPGVMIVTIDGSDADAARAQALSAIAAMTTPLDASAFAQAQAAFVYHIASDAQTPLETAGDLGWYAAEGNAAYAPAGSNERYVQIARSLDARYVAQIAQRYLKKQPLVVRSQTAQKAPSTT